MSTDAGRTWSQVTSEPRLLQRAWYYIKVFVDPKDENRRVRDELSRAALE